MEKVKTTILVGKDLLEEFKRLTSLRRGTSRVLSAEFEEALKAFSPTEIISSLALRLNLKIDAYPSLGEIAQSRPNVGASAGAAVREMRDGRKLRLLRHK